ncbi:hypothetical protein [Fibrobacter sp.]|uniref:hypothetical protein n=1 Tax=Fibrobacter sp. TaxID=35828 RepID=UPI00386775A6
MKKKFYIQLIVNTDGIVYDYGIKLNKDIAEQDLNETFDRMSEERRRVCHKELHEIELDI